MQALKGTSWLGGLQSRTPFGEAGHFSMTFVEIFLKNQGLPNLPRSDFSLAAWSIRPLFLKKIPFVGLLEPTKLESINFSYVLAHQSHFSLFVSQNSIVFLNRLAYGAFINALTAVEKINNIKLLINVLLKVALPSSVPMTLKTAFNILWSSL